MYKMMTPMSMLNGMTVWLAEPRQQLMFVLNNAKEWWSPGVTEVRCDEWLLMKRKSPRL